jgi:malate dehydrogenase
MSRDDLFNVNAGIVRDLVAACAKHCPKAVLNIISNPVNSTVPIAAEVLKKEGVYDPKRLLGVTHLDVMRARVFVAQALGADPNDIDVPVVGGHAGITILPLLSQVTCSQKSDLSAAQVEHLTERVQNGGTEVVNAKAGAGSATLSMAAAAAEFAAACLRALAGHRNVTAYAYVASDAVRPLPFFATKVRLGRDGVEHNYGVPSRGTSPFEKAALEKLVPELRASIDKGVAFVANGDEAHRRRVAQQRRAAAGQAGNSDVRASGVSQIPA